MNNATRAGPLTGLRVLEIGHFIAAPFGTRLLGDLGADVIKIEPPAGDPVRQWGTHIEGNSPWWSQHGRNKRCITLNLKHPKAKDIVLGLAAKSDAVVENFRPGQLARLGLGPDVLREARADLVIAHVSGYGQDGPYRDKAAFGVIGESVGGLRHLSDHAPGMTDLPPVRVGVSIGDSIAGLYAAFGVMAALWQRDRRDGDSRARSLDVALSESVLSMMEGMLPEYGVLGDIKQPTGSRIATAAPTSGYVAKDGKWVLIAGNSDPLFARLSKAMDQPGLPLDPRFQDNRSRVANVEDLDAIIGEWTVQYDADALLAILAEADIPSSLVYTAADIAADPQYRHRDMVREVEDPLFGDVLQAGIVPGVPEDPGRVRWPGPKIGAHNEEVLEELLGFSANEIQRLRDLEVI
ncbi:MAG: carnitine dehydratase [Rhodospirillaceae bacterium]|jgi:formyl-CoA transferase|nr:carnitine dehydratase [Rhodospirillaceae bacterium]